MRRSFVLLMCLAAMVAAPAGAVEEHALVSAALTKAPGNVLKAERVTYAPGESSPPHQHDDDAYVYVLSGHIRSQVEGHPVRVYAPGEDWFEPAGARHLVSGNASKSEPATMLVVFVGKPAQPTPRTQSR
jgi:quercetin dioxygenase-like cupin family protein